MLRLASLGCAAGVCRLPVAKTAALPGMQKLVRTEMAARTAVCWNTTQPVVLTLFQRLMGMMYGQAKVRYIAFLGSTIRVQHVY